MRRGRFASVSGNADAIAPLSFIDLLLVDLLAARDQTEERIGMERVRTLAHSARFLLTAHFAAGATLLASLAFAGHTANLFAIGTPLIGLLLLDGGFWHASRRQRSPRLKPHLVVRLSVAYMLAISVLWTLLAGLALQVDSVDTVGFRIALAIGFVLPIMAFLSIPVIVALGSAISVLAASAFAADPLLTFMATMIGGSVTLFSIFSARDAVLSTNRRLSMEWEAQKAMRFVLEFEQSGRGWFWETDASGALSYVSDQLAEDFERPAEELLGTHFADLLMVEQNAADSLERTLAFHLSARFAFSDVTVRANTEKDVWWSLSGSPIFDPYGRFLGFRGIGTDLTEQRRSEAEISRLARFDSLTGLPNRAQMRQTLDDALRGGGARKGGCALFLIDLDRFKNVNDTLGHPAGDDLLRQVAQRLSSVIGEQGQIGRLGGDEFKAVFPDLSNEARLGALAEQLIHRVSMPYTVQGHTVSIGASVGIAIARSPDTCADALVRDADLALYAAKAAGRGTFCFFAPEMHSEAKDRQILENDLRNAIVREELKLLYQPIVSTVTEQVVGFEALLRWEHPTRGMVSPIDFIPLAEECGLIVGIGAWVLRTACAQAAEWPRGIRIAVNLSPIQFGSPGLPGLIVNALAASNLEPSRLELEITESVFLADSVEADQMFAKLKSIGVRLALDDFGTGYSSLGYLKKAPFDKIKIDQSFVRGAATPGSRNAALIKAIVAMADGLGMETTAEGANTLDELTLIRELGCSQIQGFIFGKPMEADDATTMAKASQIAAREEDSRAPRHGLLRMATLHSESGSLSVRLRNISTGGALLEADEGLDAGSLVKLDLPGCGTLEGEVRWSQGERIGIRFSEEFDLNRLAPSKKGTRNVKVLKPDYVTLHEEAVRENASERSRLRRG